MYTNIKFISTSFRNWKKARLCEHLTCFKPILNKFISTDNVHILCLSFNVKKSKTTANLSENIRNKRHSNRLPWCHLSRPPFYWYRFLTVALHESST